MRLPLAKIYRAFPELDPFPDEECQRYIRYAYRQARFRIGCIPVVAFVVALVLMATINGLIISALDRSGMDSETAIVAFLVLFISMFAIPAVLALIVRDKVLFRVLYDRIKTARCPECAFSLLGLPVKDGAARCPECGKNIILRQHNLTPEDLMIRRIGEDGPEDQDPKNCSKCGHSLGGVSIERSSVRCPDCGHIEVLHKRAVMQSLHGGRAPRAYVDQHARITSCPACTTTLIGLPIEEAQARCMECGFIASVEPRPEDKAPISESASEVGLRIKRRRTSSPSVSEGDCVEDASGDVQEPKT